ncbi:MAG: hypothetical protein IT304_11485 [Dehalococcoidia bacterium]|nr:hypothetical protein [Dehalococcoidia bacterium]
MTRPRPAGGDGWLARGVLAAMLLAWLGLGLTILSHRLYVSNDSISNYGHVWYVAHELWHGDGVPFAFPEMGHGDALAFPYAFVPWLSAALFRPLLGDWVVTLWLVLGAAGVLAATWWAFPELRRPWRFAVVCANPMLVEALILAQLPFLWGTALLFAAVAAWRRRWTVAAVLLMALAQATHPAVVMPLAGCVVLGWLPFERRRLRLAWAYAASVVLALPAVAMVFLSPVVEDASTATLVGNFFGTVGLRAFVVGGPFLVILVGRWRPALLPAMFVFVLALNVALLPVRHTAFAWNALTRDEDRSLVPFLESSAFAPGATYRVLRSNDGKVGMYEILRAGGRLDSEFFPESVNRRSWPTAEEYVSFLDGRKIDFVVLYASYDANEHTNEHALLEWLAAAGRARLVERNALFDVYDVRAG